MKNNLNNLQKIIFITIIYLGFLGLAPSSEAAMQRLEVSPNGHFLVKEDGSPFFWMGDTAWSMITIPPADVTLYMNNRAQNKFNIIHVDADSYGSANYAGQRPFVNDNPDLPNEAWWQHLDFIISEAEAKGIYVCLFTMWSNIWDGSNSYGGYLRFNGDTAKAYRFGNWIGSRYKNRINVIWSVAGEYNEISQKALFDSVAQGLKDAHGGTQIMTIHPSGDYTSSVDFHLSSWLNFNMIQAPNEKMHTLVTNDYNLIPAKPVVVAESSYEESVVAGLRITPADVRREAYWSVFSGSLGVTYGHMSIQTMNNPLERKDLITPWKDALNAPGGLQMQHLRILMESYPFLSRIPDQSIILSRVGTDYHHVRTTRDSNGTYALVYVPDGAPVTVDMGKITGGNIDASWYDPRTGAYTSIGTFPNNGSRTFDAPGSTAEGNDWVLVLDASRQVPSLTPIAHWKLDETSGTTAFDSSGNNNGTLNGPVWISGKIGNALSFDGTDDYVNIGNPASLQLTGAMTITAWIYLNNVNATAHRIVSKLGVSGQRGWELVLDDDPDNNLLMRISSDGTTIIDAKQAIKFDGTGRLVFVTGTYVPSTSLNIYRDGVLIASNTASIPASQFNSNQNVNIGRGPAGYSPFNGKIDDVRIYNRALSAAEIQSLYQSAVIDTKPPAAPPRLREK